MKSEPTLKKSIFGAQGTTLLIETLQKSKKNYEDAQLIYDNIRSFRFFENFFAQNLRTMDHSGVLALCKEFGHEHIPIGRFVFQKGDPSNNKFYVILSGRIGIVIPRKDSVVVPRRSSIRKSILKQNSKKPSIEPIQLKSPRDRSQSPEELDGSNSSKKRSIIVNDSRRTTFIANQSESESNKSGFNINLVKIPEGNSDKSPSPLKQARSPRRSKTFQGFISSITLKKDKEKDSEPDQETENPIVPILPIENIQRETPEVLSPHDEEEDEDDTPPVDFNELRDKGKFEDYASRFGVLVRYMGPGESFGELALKNNAPRSASVICSDDCEFLVITKQQFELIFEKKDREKEEFIKTTFPFLTSMSTFIANYVLLSFKTEVVKKGSYLAKEGRVTAEDSKFYLIHKGECLVEKVVSIQLNSPLNKTKFIAKDSQTAQISVVGQGTIAGEEILINKDSYNYSVKTLSDGVLVHSVSKKDFDSIFFKDFHEHLISMYLKKKKQRDIIFETVRKDHEAKADELKAKNIYSVQNTKMGNVLSAPALQSLSRYMHREQNNMSNNTPVNANGQFSLTSPKNSTYQADSFGGFMASRNMPGTGEEDSFQIDSPTLEKKKFPKIIDLRDPNRQGVAQRLEYLSKVSDSPKRRDSPAEIADFSSIKLFETEPSKTRKNIRKPSMFGGESPSNRGAGVGYDIEKDSPPPSMFKEAAMRTRIRPLSIGMPEQPEHDEEPSPLLRLNMPVSPIASLVRVRGNGENTESKQTTIPELSISKSIGGHLGVHDLNNKHNLYAVLVGNNGNISGKYQQQNQIKMFGKPQEGALKSGRVALPQLKTLNLDKIGQGNKKAKEEAEDDENSFDEFEASTKGQTTYLNGISDRPAYLSSRFGEKQSSEKLSPEIKSAKGVFSFQSELGNLLKGYRAQHSVRLKVTQDWRSKVFQKTSGPNQHPHHKRIASEEVNVTSKLGITCSPIVKGKAAKTKNQASKAK